MKANQEYTKKVIQEEKMKVVRENMVKVIKEGMMRVVLGDTMKVAPEGMMRAALAGMMRAVLAGMKRAVLVGMMRAAPGGMMKVILEETKIKEITTALDIHEIEKEVEVKRNKRDLENEVKNLGSDTRKIKKMIPEVAVNQPSQNSKNLFKLSYYTNN